MLITVPQLLAANHVPEAKIASVTAFGLFATFASFPFTPILDWRFSRRVYAVGLAIVAALLSFAALLEIHNLTILAALLFASSFTVQLCINAVGGWFGNETPTERKNALGAWLAVANISAGGVGRDRRPAFAARPALCARRRIVERDRRPLAAALFLAMVSAGRYAPRP